MTNENLFFVVIKLLFVSFCYKKYYVQRLSKILLCHYESVVLPATVFRR